MMKIDQHKDQFQQMMAPFYGAPTKMQNRHPADVQDRNQGLPLGDDEPADHCVILVERQQPDSTTKPDSRPKDTTTAAPMTISVRAEQVIEDQPIPRVLQSFYWWISGMMTNMLEKTQVCAINTAKSTICDVLSEEMANTAVPSVFEEGYEQPVMAPTAWQPESRDTHVVQFLDESGGGGDSRATASQQGHGATTHSSEEPCGSRSQYPSVCSHQEDLNQLRVKQPKVKSVVQKPIPPPPPAVFPTKNVSPKHENWNKRTIQEQLAAHDLKKTRSMAAGIREYVKLMEERQQAAKENSAVRTLLPDTVGKVTLREGEASSPAQSATGPVRVKKEEPKNGDAINCPPAEDDDSLDKGVLDEGGQLTPIDNLVSLEDEYLLEFECAPRSVEKMTLSPSESQREEFTFIKLAMPASVSMTSQKPISRPPVPEPDYQLMPRGISLI